MIHNAPQKPFSSPTVASARLGVPKAWLLDEANAGRLPHLKVGRRIFFSLELLEASLKQRAEREASQPCD